MKDLFIIPECYIDTNLVETFLSSTYKCNFLGADNKQ